MTLASFWVAMIVVALAVVIVMRARASIVARVALVVAMIAGGAALARRPPQAAPLSGPRISRGRYVGSATCASCHPSEHSSWSRTYHRTMTQRATSQTMLAHPASDSPIVMTTGSHHMQGYWTEDDRGALHMLPQIFARDEGRLIPRRDAFLQPPDAEQHDVRWGSNCIACHATAGRPNLGSDAVGGEARHAIVGELGIACEACHGPGQSHEESERDPFTRWGGHATAIVDPARLSAERANAVCGQCHAYTYPRDEENFWANGYSESFRAGDALEPSRIVLTPETLADPKGPKVDTDARNLFWPDGTVRVGGREYNAMVLSACYARGEADRKITCLSCHSMHQSDPNDQLRRDRSVQNTCISCHEMAANHTHHAIASSGSECVACHMPKTSYALRSAIRSHRIDSPSPTNAKPSACNLCHLDRSRAWANDATARLWGKPVATTSDASAAPASVVGLLSADAAERVIWADAMGDASALEISGRDWERPVLEAATRDPYAVIRFIAHRSLHALGDVKGHATISDATIDALVSRRDNRDVFVAE